MKTLYLTLKTTCIDGKNISPYRVKSSGHCLDIVLMENYQAEPGFNTQYSTVGSTLYVGLLKKIKSNLGKSIKVLSVYANIANRNKILIFLEELFQLNIHFATTFIYFSSKSLVKLYKKRPKFLKLKGKKRDQIHCFNIFFIALQKLMSKRENSMFSKIIVEKAEARLTIEFESTQHKGGGINRLQDFYYYSLYSYGSLVKLFYSVDYVRVYPSVFVSKVFSAIDKVVQHKVSVELRLGRSRHWIDKGTKQGVFALLSKSYKQIKLSMDCRRGIIFTQALLIYNSRNSKKIYIKIDDMTHNETQVRQLLRQVGHKSCLYFFDMDNLYVGHTTTLSEDSLFIQRYTELWK